MTEPLPLPRLACPRDRSPLEPRGPRRLACAHGHEYPVVDGVPVLLRDDVPQTMALAAASQAAAREWARRDADPPASELFLATVGIDDRERAEARRLAAAGGPIDPVASVLVAATNGIAYRHLVARLASYPIPDFRLPPGEGRTLLDVGCGWGRWSISAARRGYRVVGVDPSLGAILAARRVARGMGLDIGHVCADARYLPFAAEAFDVAWSHSVIQHFSRDDARAAFAQAARVLRPGGYLQVQMANARGVRSLYHLARRGFAEGEGFEVRYWTLRELRDALAPLFPRLDITVHCYFGLGLEASDRHLVPAATRAAIAASEALRGLSGPVRVLRQLADSVYVAACKEGGAA